MRTTRNSANDMETLLCGIGIVIFGFIIGKIFEYNDLMEAIAGVAKIVGIIVVGFGYHSIKETKKDLYTPKKYNSVMFYTVHPKSNDEEIEESDIDNPQTDVDVPINPMPQPSINPMPQPSTGHWEDTQEQCDNCAGRGYNIRYIWVGGGHDNKEMEMTCSMCHGKGFITKREYVMDY